MFRGRGGILRSAAGATWTALVVGWAGGCVVNKGVGELDRPAFVMRRGNDLCGETWAVDGMGRGWYKHDCEGGAIRLTAGSMLTEQEMAALVRAFATLPAAAKLGCVYEDHEGFETEFRKLGLAGASRTWRACVDEQGRLEAPYERAAEQMERGAR